MFVKNEIHNFLQGNPMQKTLERSAAPSFVSGSETESLRPYPCPFQASQPANVTIDWSRGVGTRHPEVPESQRQYDGENPFENCESWNLP